MDFCTFESSFTQGIRRGIIQTNHGVIRTPTFVPVATNGCIKGCDSHHLRLLDIDLIFCNTYHLLVHPGEKVIKNAGGIHIFMDRDKPIITDSGGFQIFSLLYGGVTEEIKSSAKKRSLSQVVKISEEGVLFSSYHDGSPIMITPESTIKAQKLFGSDIVIPLDELLPYHTDPKKLHISFERTHRWQLRSLQEHRKSNDGQIIYGVIHGGLDPELRKKSCKILSEAGFDGFAIGGSLGKSMQDVISVLKYCIPHLPPEKPRHLLGIADMDTLSHAVMMGIDSFDSAYPTKCARHGTLFTESGERIKILQGRWKDFHQPISKHPYLNRYTFAYLHHLFKAHELTAYTIASMYNILALSDFCKKMTKNIGF